MYLHCILCQAVEQLAPRGGGATGESERELIEVVIQMVRSDSALVRAEQPSLQQRHDAVDAGQEIFTRGLTALHDGGMAVAGQASVRQQAIGDHRAGRRDGPADKAVQARSQRRASVERR